jgi:DNA-binding transcriptional ArsR family regulator
VVTARVPPDALPTRADVVDMADVFGLLSDPGRLHLLVLLQRGEASVGQLAQQSGMSEFGASHALRLLRAHRVVSVRREGRLSIYRLDDDHVTSILGTAWAHAEHSPLVHPERTTGTER